MGEYGYHFGPEIARLAQGHDAQYIAKLGEMTQKEQKIHLNLDRILHTLEGIHAKMQDPFSKKTINLEDLKQSLQEVKKCFEDAQELYPELKGIQFPLEDFEKDLSALTPHQAQEVIRVLESFKRHHQNALPLLMNQFQLITQLFTAIVSTFRAMQESEARAMERQAQRLAPHGG